jgi:endonuclease YncB( thermonuclease family)
MPMTYIWATDGSENLNLMLVKKGALPATDMLDAVQFDALSKGTAQRAAIEAGAAYARKVNPNLPQIQERPPRRLVSDSDYGVFLKALTKANAEARTQKKGIWSDKLKYLRD